MTHLHSFPEEVHAPLRYYVYRLVDPRDGATFYVGKGQGNRVFAHQADEPEQDDEEGLTALGVSEKQRRLRAIAAAGLEVVRIIHRHGLDGPTALEVEATLIDAYPALTNLQSGHDPERGARAAAELIAEYEAPEFGEHGHRLLLVSISDTREFRGTYDAARFAWRASLARVEKEVQYVVAHVRGLVVGVFVAEEWLPATPAHFPEFSDAREDTRRIGFKGGFAPEEIASLYKGRRVPAKYLLRGAANPVRYVPR